MRRGHRRPLRMRVGSKVAESLFWGLSHAGRLHPFSRLERHGIEVFRNLAYRDTGLGAHQLDIYRPTGVERPLPICLYVHGGGFRILSKDSHWIMGLMFARQGYLVFNVNYRLAPRYPFPHAVEDVCSAYEWVVNHAEEWGGDASRLVCAGESAGANLVTALSVALCYDRPEPFTRGARASGILPKAVVPACGLFEVSNIERYHQIGLPRLLEDRLTEVSLDYLPDTISIEERDLADPIRVFERGDRPDRSMPAFFIPCGSIDPIHGETRRLGHALERLGVRSEVRFYGLGHHAFHALVMFPNARQCWRDTFEFLSLTCTG